MIYNRAFGECVKSFQDFEFVFIGCTKSSVIRYDNTEYKNVIRNEGFVYAPFDVNKK